MPEERRKSNRMDIDVTISLHSVVGGKLNVGNENESIKVELVNISRGGIGFRTEQKLMLNTYYDTTIVLWTKEKFETVIEIVRMENYGEEKTLYGCRFIGLMPSDQLKIQIYEMITEMEKNQEKTD